MLWKVVTVRLSYEIGCGSYGCKLLLDVPKMGQMCSPFGRCLHEANYIDGTYTTGKFAYEILTIGDTTDKISEFSFGCGNEQIGERGREAGILALGLSAVSFMSQTVELYRKMFSYCLPPPDKVGFLKLGVEEQNEPLVGYTPFGADLRNPYLINITAVYVDNEIVDMQPWGSMVHQIVVDSGTPITRGGARARLAGAVAWGKVGDILI